MKIRFLSMSLILMSVSSAYCMQPGTSCPSELQPFDGRDTGFLHPETVLNDIKYARAYLLESFEGRFLNGLSLEEAFEDLLRAVQLDLHNLVYWKQLNKFFTDVVHAIDERSLWMCSNSSRPIRRLQRCISLVVKQLLKADLDYNDEIFQMDEDLENRSDESSENDERKEDELKKSQREYEERENRVNTLRAFNSRDPHLERYARRIQEGQF